MSNVSRIFRVAGDVGHQVMLNPDGAALKGVSDGEVVTIKDFAARFEGRTDGLGIPPGLWRNYAWATILDARGRTHEVRSDCLTPLPGRDYLRLPRVLLADLPETPLWEDDVVETYEGRIGTVSRVNYDVVGDPDSQEYRIRFDEGSVVDYHARALTLLDRGDVWRFYNGEKPFFDDAVAEAMFYHRTSQVTAVHNREEDTASFDWNRAVAMLESGQADVIWHNWVVAVADPGYRVFCYSIDDPEVGERCRLELLDRIEAATALAY